MTRVLRSFLPRSWVLLVLVACGVVAGGLLAPLVDVIVMESRDVSWFAQYMATTVLAVVGIALGNAIGSIRGWAPSLLVPGMLRAHLQFASMVLVVTWLCYVGIMVANESLAGLPITGSLAIGSLCLMIGAGVHRILVWPLVALSAFMGVSRDIVTELLRHPAAEYVLLAIYIISMFELFRISMRAPADSDSSLLQSLSFRELDTSRAAKSRYASMLSLSRMTPRQALAAVFDHSPMQAWINVLLAFVTLNGFVLVLALSFSGEIPDDFVLLSAVLCGLLAMVSPFVGRDILNAVAPHLWLFGVHASRVAFSRSVFLHLLRPAFRLVAIGLLAVAMMFGISKDLNTYVGSLTVLLTSAGTASMLLLTALLMEKSTRTVTLQTVLFALLVITEIGGGMWIAINMALHISWPFALLAAVAYSGLLTVICCVAYSWRVNRYFL